MAKRNYESALRTEAAAETRARLVSAAAELLRDPKGAVALSMDAVAKAASVTRLTVYNQFGGRAALLEAVFDARAAEGGLSRIPEAMAMHDAYAGLMKLVAIFCDFWASDSGLGRLHDAASHDVEFAVALAERNERRRKALAVLVRRLGVKSTKGKDLIDALFGLTSQSFYAAIASQERSAQAASAIVAKLCEATIKVLS